MQENNRTEFKEQLNDKLEREIVAFLNYREGGDLYIGIDDNGAAVGVDDPDGVQLAAMDRIKSNIMPTTLGLFDVVTETHDGKVVIHIIISSGPDKPYYIRKYGMSPKGCYIRVGSSSQPMEAGMIDDLYSRRTRNSLNKILSPRQKLSFEQLQIYYQSKELSLNEIFSDRIQITSYGGLPTGLSREDFFNCRSMSRNRELMRVFKDIGLVEQLGSGMSRILKAYDRSIFDISDNFMVVTFKFPDMALPKTDDKKPTIKTDGKKPTIKTRDNKQKIIAYLKSNGQGKNKDFAELLGLKSTRVKELLYELVNEDVIKPQGSNRNRTYILTDKAN